MRGPHPAEPGARGAATALRANRLRKRLAERLRREFEEHGQPAGDMDGETLVEALMAHLSIPVISSSPERTWIWSDLHLGDSNALAFWNRPFPNVHQMNAHLLQEWERAVGPDDTVICLGDITVKDAWRDAALIERLRRCPGHRWLVLGNHDVQRTRALHGAGFETMCAAAVYTADPPLALSHPPLPFNPRGAVNVHGHLHGEPTGSGRVDVCVEQTRWRPLRMDVLLEQLRADSAL